jgi:cystathionine beta-lyase/cystathionine gamma-synthase
MALFCEFPGNPLLKAPDLVTIRRLADDHDFVVVVDETIGNFLNVNVLQYADIAVSSLTKTFSGSSNVMGGCAILNPHGRHYSILKQAWRTHYEDNYWAEDALFMERNSRDFISRAERVNVNAEAICSVLRAHPRGTRSKVAVHYSHSQSKQCTIQSTTRPSPTTTTADEKTAATAASSRRPSTPRTTRYASTTPSRRPRARAWAPTSR